MSDATGATAAALYVPGFKANLSLGPQQTTSRLLNAVDMDLAYDTAGTFFNADDVGTADPQAVTGRAPNSPDGFVDTVRRFGTFAPFMDGRFLDNEDMARQLEDPTSKVMLAMRAGQGRSRDTMIIGANGVGGIMGTFQQQTSLSSSLGGVQYTTGAANANVIASSYAGAHENETISAVQYSDSNYGLTIGKLINAKTQLDNSEIDEPTPGDRPSDYHFACTAYQLQDLLRSVPATSSFYTDVQGLIAGTLKYFMGFNIHRLPANLGFNPLLKTSQTRKCLAWHKRAVVYRARPIINEFVDQRKDRANRWYCFYEFNHGAVRRYDGGVIEVDCSTLDTTQFT